LALIEPHYPTAGQGRPPTGLERTQAEDSLYDSESTTAQLFSLFALSNLYLLRYRLGATVGGRASIRIAVSTSLPDSGAGRSINEVRRDIPRYP
jgi:hypothetical protein